MFCAGTGWCPMSFIVSLPSDLTHLRVLSPVYLPPRESSERIESVETVFFYSRDSATVSPCWQYRLALEDMCDSYHEREIANMGDNIR